MIASIHEPEGSIGALGSYNFFFRVKNMYINEEEPNKKEETIMTKIKNAMNRMNEWINKRTFIDGLFGGLVIAGIACAIEYLVYFK